MKKRKIEHFFTAQPKADGKDKKHFIFCPELKQAVFTFNCLESDVFIAAKSGLKLYYRPMATPFPAYALSEPNATCPYSIPLLKSNLQKAIRRGKMMAAVQSTIALLQHDRIQLLRRLPIIMLEDVKPFDCLPLLVWYMMADKDYSLSYYDHHLLLNMVASFCIHTEVIPAEEMHTLHAIDPQSSQYTPQQLQHLPQADLLLALHYRILYGGMAGDMEMLRQWIHYLVHSPHPVTPCETLFDLIDAHSIHGSVSILPEAIDFIPFPQLITILRKKYPQYSAETLQNLIWTAESGVNLRHARSVALSQAAQASSLWNQIRAYLSTVRTWMLREAGSGGRSGSGSGSGSGGGGGGREGEERGERAKSSGLVIVLDGDEHGNESEGPATRDT